MKIQRASQNIPDKEQKKHYIYCLFLLCVFTLVTGCDQTFEPLLKNDKYYFSIYGTLNAAADTQWVRVGIPRGNINETPDPSRVTVILEHVETGHSAVMQDSLFASGDVLNYWTTMPLETEHTYRIKAERDDGKSSQVTVTMPEELPTPLVTNNNVHPFGFNIYIDDSVELADLQSKWYVLVSPQTERKKRFTHSPIGIVLFIFLPMVGLGTHLLTPRWNETISQKIQMQTSLYCMLNFL